MNEKVIALRFHSLMQRAATVITSPDGFTVAGPRVLRGTENAVIAKYVAHHWEVNAQRTSSFECTGPAMLRFESAQSVMKPLGPFARLRFPNGSCYADHKLLAVLAPDARQWRYQPDGSLWDALAIVPAR